MLGGLFDRLRSRASRSGRRRRLGALVAIVVALVVAGTGWALLLPDFQIRLDPSMLLFGLAACILAWSIYVLVERRTARAAEVVVVTYDLKLAQPTLPGGRYRFELVVWSEVASRGRRERRRQARVELAFRRGEHPDLLEWCDARVDRYLRAHRRLTERLYPDATVVLAPSLGRRRRRPDREEAAPGPETVALPESRP